MPDTTILVGVFDYFVGEDRIKEIIEKYVSVENVDLKVDTASGKSLGIAVVLLKSKEDKNLLLEQFKDKDTKTFGTESHSEAFINNKLILSEWSKENELKTIIEHGQFSHSKTKEEYLRLQAKSRTRRSSSRKHRSKSPHRSRHNEKDSKHRHRHHSRDKHRDRSNSRRRGRSNSRERSSHHRRYK
ncbi:RRM domain-containing protein [Entamoeba marina]